MGHLIQRLMSDPALVFTIVVGSYHLADFLLDFFDGIDNQE